MYNQVIKLNTKKCKVCKKVFKSEKGLKDHIFHKNIRNQEHQLLQKKIRYEQFKDAKLTCPVCKQKIFRTIKTHFNHKVDKKHKEFLGKQKMFLFTKFSRGKTIRAISRLKGLFTKSFSEKYITKCLKDYLKGSEYKKFAKSNMLNERKKFWEKVSTKERKDIMKKVREAQWGSLSEEQRKNHPWVIAGRRGSLKSSKKGSKNQKHAYKLLQKEVYYFDWIYNYDIDENWQIDIACPEEEVYIEWDGRHHRIPIHGVGYLNNRKNRDKFKDKIVTNKFKGLMIRVRDDGREDIKFVEKKVSEIKSIINNWEDEAKVIRI